MKKSLILKRLWATIEKLVNLPSKKFDYGQYITEGNPENVCGTVCCVAGWYPKWFPKSGLSWVIRDYGSLGYHYPQVAIEKTSEEGRLPHIDKVLEVYHGLCGEVIGVLFYGQYAYLQLSKIGQKLIDQIMVDWKDYISIRVEDNFVRIQARRDISSSKSEVTMIFRFIHYMIENDYIVDYTHTVC